MRNSLLLLLLWVVSTGYAQIPKDRSIADMAFYGDAVMNAAASDHRARANDSLTACVDRFLQQATSFTQSLEEVPWLSEVKDSASTFRLITWQLNQGDSVFIYFGRLQSSSGQVVQLNDKKNALEPLYESRDKDSWYGARYGKLVEFERRNSKAYLLFGFNAHSRWNRQKVVDVLTFENGEPTFGLPVFIEEGQNAERYGRYRLIMTYSLDIRANLEYDKIKGMIIQDHLIAMRERFPGQGETFVTDGSYQGYKIDENGNWVYWEKLFTNTLAEPLDDGKNRPDQKKKDLFGRDRE